MAEGATAREDRTAYAQFARAESADLSAIRSILASGGVGSNAHTNGVSRSEGRKKKPRKPRSAEKYENLEGTNGHDQRRTKTERSMHVRRKSGDGAIADASRSAEADLSSARPRRPPQPAKPRPPSGRPPSPRHRPPPPTDTSYSVSSDGGHTSGSALSGADESLRYTAVSGDTSDAEWYSDGESTDSTFRLSVALPPTNTPLAISSVEEARLTYPFSDSDEAPRGFGRVRRDDALVERPEPATDAERELHQELEQFQSRHDELLSTLRGTTKELCYAQQKIDNLSLIKRGLEDSLRDLLEESTGRQRALVSKVTSLERELGHLQQELVIVKEVYEALQENCREIIAENEILKEEVRGQLHQRGELEDFQQTLSMVSQRRRHLRTPAGIIDALESGAPASSLDLHCLHTFNDKLMLLDGAASSRNPHTINVVISFLQDTLSESVLVEELSQPERRLCLSAYQNQLKKARQYRKLAHTYERMGQHERAANALLEGVVSSITRYSQTKPEAESSIVYVDLLREASTDVEQCIRYCVRHDIANGTIGRANVCESAIQDFRSAQDVVELLKDFEADEK